MRRLCESLLQEIIDVLESLTKLRESPDYELCQISEKKPGALDDLAAERKNLLEKESAELETQAAQLAAEIAELNGQESTHIVQPAREKGAVTKLIVLRFAQWTVEAIA